MTAILIAQTAIPLLLLLWMVVWPARSVLGVASQMLGTLALLLSLTHVGIWLFPPWWTPHVTSALVVLFAGWHASRTRRPAVPESHVERAAVLVFMIMTIVGVGLAVVVRQAGRAPDEPATLTLHWPLGDGRYLVVNGGNALLLNAHQESMDTSVVRLRPWRGDGHAVDIVAIDRIGLRATGFLPSNPSAYRIFGVPVRAPCSGRVVQAVDGLPDMNVPEYDRSQLAGNHVIIECGAVHVVLAHFRNGTVVVRTGDVVQAWQLLAAVGNSGGTNEPHLHIHAQRHGPAGAIFAGAPVPILFDGRYFIRGDRVWSPLR